MRTVMCPVQFLLGERLRPRLPLGDQGVPQPSWARSCSCHIFPIFFPIFFPHFPHIFPIFFPIIFPNFFPIVVPLGIGFPCWPATSRDTIPRCISAIRKRMGNGWNRCDLSSLDRSVPNMEMCSKQRQSLIASFWQNIYNYIYIYLLIYLFIYWFKMIQSATHVRKWLCDIRENSMKAPRFIYGLSKPCMFVFRFRGLSDRHPWRKTFFNAGKVHERSWKYHVHPCAFLFGLVEGSRGVFSTFFCQARRNARLCPQKIWRLWISKQSKQDIHKISYNFIVIGNSFFKTFFMNHMGDSLISRIRIDVPRPWASSIYRAARYFRCGPIVWHPWFCRNYAIWFVKKM